MRMRATNLLCLFLAPVAMAVTGHAQTRHAFEIAAGPVSGDLYVQGERLAGVVSHPPGLGRCADEALCGPPGLIASAKATANTNEGLLAIARGEVASALAPADLAAAMRLNTGKGKQKQSRLRAVAFAGDETLYVIAAAKGPVTSLRSMRKRWIGIGGRASRTRLAANALLSAARLDLAALRPAEVEGVAAIKLLREKRLDAFVWIGAKMPAELDGMLKRGEARIVPLDKGTAARLSAKQLGYAAKTVNGVSTVSVPVVWLVDEKQPSDVVYAIARAAFNQRNSQALNSSKGDPASLILTRPTLDFVVPLHTGAARLFSERVEPSN